MALKYLGWSRADQVKPGGLHYPAYVISLAKPHVAGYEQAVSILHSCLQRAEGVSAVENSKIS